jgi:hypothetical protein
VDFRQCTEGAIVDLPDAAVKFFTAKHHKPPGLFEPVKVKAVAAVPAIKGEK